MENGYRSEIEMNKYKVPDAYTPGFMLSFSYSFKLITKESHCKSPKKPPDEIWICFGRIEMLVT